MGTFYGEMLTIYREGRGAFGCLRKDVLKPIPGQGTFDWDPECTAGRTTEGGVQTLLTSSIPSQRTPSDFAFLSITTPRYHHGTCSPQLYG